LTPWIFLGSGLVNQVKINLLNLSSLIRLIFKTAKKTQPESKFELASHQVKSGLITIICNPRYHMCFITLWNSKH
jgi:hypothetical protein